MGGGTQTVMLVGVELGGVRRELGGGERKREVEKMGS
jgi:hypothetical protein